MNALSKPTPILKTILKFEDSGIDIKALEKRHRPQFLKESGSR